MPSVRLRPRPAPLRQPRQLAGAIALVVAAVLLFVPVLVLLRAPALVKRVTLSNSTIYQVNVEVAGPSGKEWLDLGGVPRESDVVVDDVEQQGSKWTFRFTSAGVFAAEMELSRSELERAGWRVLIPPGIAEPLQQAGLAPSAH